METKTCILYLQSYIPELFNFYSLKPRFIFKVACVLIPLYVANNYNLFILQYITDLFKLTFSRRT